MILRMRVDVGKWVIFLCDVVVNLWGAFWGWSCSQLKLIFQILIGTNLSYLSLFWAISDQQNRSYEVFSGLYCCTYIFCSTLCEWIILGEPLVLHRYKTYLRVGHQQQNPLVAVHITRNILYGTNLRTRTWLVNFLTTIFGFYAKFYTMSKKKVWQSEAKRRFYAASKLHTFC
jgi:hypothetical protein